VYFLSSLRTSRDLTADSSYLPLFHGTDRKKEKEKKFSFEQKRSQSIILSNKHFFEEYFLPYRSLSDKTGIKSWDSFGTEIFLPL